MWMAHTGEVYNAQFSSDETSVYSMGSDGAFCQWSINQSGRKVCVYIYISVLAEIFYRVAEVDIFSYIYNMYIYIYNL